MQTFDAPAWRADWLVAWLASLGVVYCNRSIQLSWSAESMPHAIFHAVDLQQLDDALPSVEDLRAVAIAREINGHTEFPRNPSRPEYAERAAYARRTGELSLGATVSDIGVDEKDDLPHSPFDPPAPRGITIGERAVAARLACAEGESLRDSMLGRATPATTNGLGFDLRRLAASAVPGGLVTEPFVETMAFMGISLFSQTGERTRGWRRRVSTRRTGAFRWPTWTSPLDWSGIDAALDLYFASASGGFEPSAEFHSISYRPTATSETNRGIDGVRARG